MPPPLLDRSAGPREGGRRPLSYTTALKALASSFYPSMTKSKSKSKVDTYHLNRILNGGYIGRRFRDYLEELDQIPVGKLLPSISKRQREENNGEVDSTTDGEA